jgi:hypothetical protein
MSAKSKTAKVTCVQRPYPDEKYIFQQIQHWPTSLGPPSSSWQILDTSGVAVIFTGLEPAGLLYLEHPAGKPGDVLCLSGHPESIRRCRMGPASGGIHLQDLLLIPPPPGGVMTKVAPTLNWWVSKSPWYANQPFSGLPSASIGEGDLYIEKKTVWSMIDRDTLWLGDKLLIILIIDINCVLIVMSNCKFFRGMEKVWPCGESILQMSLGG